MYGISNELYAKCSNLLKKAYGEGKADGRDEAWECAGEIIAATADNEFKNAFDGYNIQKIFAEYSASEAIEIIKEYEKKKRAGEDIEVGDEVLYKNKRHIVTVKYEFVLDMVSQEGVVSHNIEKGLVLKTGRHFDQIAEVLEQMRESEDKDDI